MPAREKTRSWGCQKRNKSWGFQEEDGHVLAAINRVFRVGLINMTVYEQRLEKD